jgi:hypothetical protein
LLPFFPPFFKSLGASTPKLEGGTSKEPPLVDFFPPFFFGIAVPDLLSEPPVACANTTAIVSRDANNIFCMVDSP